EDERGTRRLRQSHPAKEREFGSRLPAALELIGQTFPPLTGSRRLCECSTCSGRALDGSTAGLQLLPIPHVQPSTGLPRVHANLARIVTPALPTRFPDGEVGHAIAIQVTQPAARHAEVAASPLVATRVVNHPIRSTVEDADPRTHGN